jgi:hypothetical protein
MFLIMAMIGVYNVEELAHPVLQVCGVGFDIVKMGIWKESVFGQEWRSHYRPLRDPSRWSIECSNFSLNLCIIARSWGGGKRQGRGIWR